MEALELYKIENEKYLEFEALKLKKDDVRS